MARAVLSNFSKGEIAPLLYGRIDTDQYKAGLKLARNWMVQRYGGITFRPGTRLVGKWDDPTNPLKFVPFQFAIDQAYILVMGQGMMRPIVDGGYVVEQDTKITGITLGATTNLTIPYHGLSAGDHIYLSGITGTAELNGRIANVLSVPDANHVVIDIDSTAMTAFVSSAGTLNSVPPAAPPAPPTVPPVVDPPAAPDVAGQTYDYSWVPPGFERFDY